jgi:hypothetical protein
MTDPRIDTYILKAQPFAKAILRRLRAVVHRACPDVQETMKWRFLHFDYKGMFCAMAAFKAHCTFGFWKHTSLVERGILDRAGKKALAAFTAFSPSDRREYVPWVTEAKSGDTRRRRLETAVAWMAEGKSRNWKYEVRR